jgi:hypothetical protein
MPVIARSGRSDRWSADGVPLMGVQLVRVCGELDLISAPESVDWLAGQLAHLNLSSPLSSHSSISALRFGLREESLVDPADRADPANRLRPVEEEPPRSRDRPEERVLACQSTSAP